MKNVLRMRPDPKPDSRVEEIFGQDTDCIEAVANRAERMLPDEMVIVWECDPANFQFSYVSRGADRLGYPLERWVSERTFWASRVVHEDDRDDAVTYCLLATEKARDHEFEYRAVTAAGKVVWLRDLVKVVRDDAGRVASLRGVMFDITAEKTGEQSVRPSEPWPSREELLRTPSAPRRRQD